MRDEGSPDPLEELFDAASEKPPEIRDTVPPPPLGPPPPLNPRSILLPLHKQDGFEWPQFEGFCVELLELQPAVKAAYLFGGSGSTQEGIDIVVEFVGGAKLGVQCKQEKQFGQKAVESAVENTTYQADRYWILLSREATAGARRAIDAHSRWELLDVGDISRLVRRLPPEKARQLVETHFGAAWRQRFLGRTGPALFLSASSVSAESADESRLFHQGWDLVGRDQELEALRRFRGSDRCVAVLPGRGGIGKSRLLTAFADEVDGDGRSIVVHLAANVPATPEGLDELPLDVSLVIIDDAHRRDDLEQILDLLRHRQERDPALKVVIGTRPRRLDELRSTLARSGFESAHVDFLDELDELEPGDVRRLAEQALGRDHLQHVDALCAVSRDCPLVTVVGGQLIRRNSIHAALLENDEEFRYQTMAAFEDELLGDIESAVSREEARALLEVLAAVGPLPMGNSEAVNAVAAFLERRADRVKKDIGHLEKAGVLRRSGDQLRVSPDLLSDFVLKEACLTKSGESSGFAELVYRHFGGVLPGHVLRNLAELDWKARAAGSEVDLLGEAWEDLRRELLAAGNAKRIALLGRLEAIAYFQASQVLKIVESLLEHPNDPETEPKDELVEQFGLRPRTTRDVLEKLPPVLEAIAYTDSTVERVTEILWSLGQDDSRDENPHPEHPMRILGEMAGYAPAKPVGFNELVLTAVGRELGKPGAHEHRNSLLSIVGHALEREGLNTWSRSEREVVMSGFLINPGPTRKVRAKAIALLRDAALGGDVRAATIAVKTIGNALGGPRGYFGREISDDEQSVWKPEQLELIEVLAEVVASGARPTTLLAVVDALAWQIEFSPWPEVVDAAKKVVDAIEETLTLEVAGILHKPWSVAWRPSATERFGAPSRERAELAALTERIARDVIQEVGTPGAALELVEGAAAELAAAEERPNPAPLLMALCRADFDWGLAIASELIDNPSRSLVSSLHALIVAIREQDADRARALCLAALDAGDEGLAGAVARAYWSPHWVGSRNETDVEIIERLVEAEEPVRAVAVAGVGVLATVEPDVAARIAVDVVVGDSAAVAEELC
nr:restriction endonuclease [Actinomycetota bacterium]